MQDNTIQHPHREPNEFSCMDDSPLNNGYGYRDDDWEGEDEPEEDEDDDDYEPNEYVL